MSGLPPHEIKVLNHMIATGDVSGLRSRVALLRSKGWTLRQLAEVVGVSHTTISNWEDTPTNPDSRTTLSPKAVTSAGVKTVRWYVRLTSKDREQLADLSKSAKKVTSASSTSSQNYRDSLMLDELIVAHLHRMVPITEIAEAMDVTHRAVRARLERRNDSK